MTNDGKSWKTMERAKEDIFFEEQNKIALEKLKARAKKRLSPISGEPMEEVVYKGVVIDRCVQSGGIWLDAGELEQILDVSHKGTAEEQSSWLDNFVGFLKK